MRHNPRCQTLFVACRVVCCVAGLLTMAAPAQSASSAFSTASDSASTSVGSASDSIRGSSDSSSRQKRVAQGHYEVIDVAAVPDEPWLVRVTLAAVAGSGAEGEFFLHLPKVAALDGKLLAGQVVKVTHRGYGLEFARADTRQAFFLALADGWLQELRTLPVQL